MKSKNPGLVALGLVVGIVFLVISLVYFTHKAESLPSFFPGHTAGLTKIHSTHGIASLIIAFAGFIFAWFQTGPKTTSAA